MGVTKMIIELERGNDEEEQQQQESVDVEMAIQEENEEQQAGTTVTGGAENETNDNHNNHNDDYTTNTNTNTNTNTGGYNEQGEGVAEEKDKTKESNNNEDEDKDQIKYKGYLPADQETASETASSTEEEIPMMDHNISANTDDPNNNGLRVGDFQVPMPMALPTTTLRRQVGTRANPDSVPGAQAIEGSGGSGESRNNVVEDHLENEPAMLEEGQVNNTPDEHVIDEAVLVVPEEQQDQEQWQQSGMQDESTQHQEVFEGQIVQQRPQQQEQTPKRWFWLVVVLVLAAVVAFLVSFFTLREGGAGNNPSGTSTTPGTSTTNGDNGGFTENIVYPPFRDDLPSASIKAMELVGSPVYLANRWMLNDPNLHSYSLDRQLQRLTMAALYYGTSGENWINQDGWLDYDVSECDWYSYTVVEELKGQPICDDDDNLRILAVANNNLSGVIADMSGFRALPHVPHVYALDIANNNITGPTPVIHTGVPIEIISLSNNGFTNIAPAMGEDGWAVRYLHVDNNNLQVKANNGILWIIFPGLISLNVTNNAFEGEFYSAMKACVNLTYLGFADNKMYGPLPSELGLLTKLQQLDISGNSDLTGTIPSQLGLLTNTLQLLDIQDTGISEQLPAEFCTNNYNNTEQEEPSLMELLADSCNSSAVQSCGCQ